MKEQASTNEEKKRAGGGGYVGVVVYVRVVGVGGIFPDRSWSVSPPAQSLLHLYGHAKKHNIFP